MNATVIKHRKPEPASTTKPKPRPQARPSFKEPPAKVRRLDKASEAAADRRVAVQKTTKAKRRQGEKLAPRKDAKVEAASKPNVTAPNQQKAVATAAMAPLPVEQSHADRSTKQERMLTLLSRPEGASIEEMMQATNWQQNSVRGFLAGTVKK
ncbi:MAG: DUF3489 domain-containing protein [Methylocystis sp.]|uniref:DUF3489 domain-containing protein n=1 Tax=Methylocystis sp. TaxID=1911079 RepID=UPI003DA2E0CE